MTQRDSKGGENRGGDCSAGWREGQLTAKKEGGTGRKKVTRKGESNVGKQDEGNFG